MKKKLKFHIKTYGCQMNERDSEAISAALEAGGLNVASGEEDADILVFNTCSVRETAERKAVGKIGIIKKLKKDRPDLIIGVAGCMAQRMKDELFAKLPHIDFVAGTGQIHKIPEIIKSIITKREKIITVGETPEDEKELLDGFGGHLYVDGKISAFVSVMRGCSRFCSYCIVPYVRGAENSRPQEIILREIRGLADKGIREIVLLGQNIAAYGLEKSASGRKKSNFAELLGKIEEIDGILRVRFTSPHPAYFSEDLIDAVVSLPKVCKNVHLPMQSGSDNILKKMNRPYTSAEYLAIVEKLRKGAPGMTFSTDVIVGFPGETEEDFLHTRDLMDKAAFDNAFIFKYSPREGTKAANFADDVPKAVKEERNQILLKDLALRAEKHNKSMVGLVVEILVEGPSKRNSEKWCGRTGSNKVVIFEPEGGISVGDMLNVKISRATSMSLYA